MLFFCENKNRLRRKKIYNQESVGSKWMRVTKPSSQKWSFFVYNKELTTV